MRITKRRLRRIILETLQDVERPEDVEVVEDETGAGDNLEHSIDYTKVMTGEDTIATPEMIDIVVKEVRRRISEKKDQNKDGENDFDDVKIARMKASGMSDEEIKKKHPELFKETVGDLVGKIIAKIADKKKDVEPAGRNLGYNEAEGRATKGALDKLARYSQSLHDKIRDEDDLPEWVQYKIAISAENIGKVYHYLDYKMRRMEEG